MSSSSMPSSSMPENLKEKSTRKKNSEKPEEKSILKKKSLFWFFFWKNLKAGGRTEYPGSGPLLAPSYRFLVLMEWLSILFFISVVPALVCRKGTVLLSALTNLNLEEAFSGDFSNPTSEEESFLQRSTQTAEPENVRFQGPRRFLKVFMRAEKKKVRRRDRTTTAHVYRPTYSKSDKENRPFVDNDLQLWFPPRSQLEESCYLQYPDVEVKDKATGKTIEKRHWRNQLETREDGSFREWGAGYEFMRYGFLGGRDVLEVVNESVEYFLELLNTLPCFTSLGDTLRGYFSPGNSVKKRLLWEFQQADHKKKPEKFLTPEGETVLVYPRTPDWATLDFALEPISGGSIQIPTSPLLMIGFFYLMMSFYRVFELLVTFTVHTLSDEEHNGMRTVLETFGLSVWRLNSRSLFLLFFPAIFFMFLPLPLSVSFNHENNWSLDPTKGLWLSLFLFTFGCTFTIILLSEAISRSNISLEKAKHKALLFMANVMFFTVVGLFLFLNTHLGVCDALVATKKAVQYKREVYDPIKAAWDPPREAASKITNGFMDAFLGTGRAGDDADIYFRNEDYKLHNMEDLKTFLGDANAAFLQEREIIEESEHSKEQSPYKSNGLFHSDSKYTDCAVPNSLSIWRLAHVVVATTIPFAALVEHFFAISWFGDRIVENSVYYLQLAPVELEQRYPASRDGENHPLFQYKQGGLSPDERRVIPGEDGRYHQLKLVQQETATGSREQKLLFERAVTMWIDVLCGALNIFLLSMWVRFLHAKDAAEEAGLSAEQQAIFLKEDEERSARLRELGIAEGDETLKLTENEMLIRALPDSEIGLDIINLTKIYKGGVRANNGVNFRVKKGEIFGLLGHNGAGKSTLFKQIGGTIGVTGGDVKIGGFSVRDDPEKARESLAYCPQDNPMWEFMTLGEQLSLFAAIEGLRGEEARARIDYVANLTDLGKKLNTKTPDLSGGQKRRMWLASCLLKENATTLLLDEPTTGLDPSTRQELWRLLKYLGTEEKKTILFTTHYLDEADTLGSRKVILAEGRVRALGTSAELKKAHGAGYWLNLSLDENALDLQGLGLNSEEHAKKMDAAWSVLERDVVKPALGYDRNAKAVRVGFLSGRTLDSFSGTLDTTEHDPKPSKRLSLSSELGEDLSTEFQLSWKYPSVETGRGLSRMYNVPWSKSNKLGACLDALEKSTGKQIQTSKLRVHMTTLADVFDAVGYQSHLEALGESEMISRKKQSLLDQAVSRLPLRSRPVSGSVRAFSCAISAVFEARWLMTKRDWATTVLCFGLCVPPLFFWGKTSLANNVSLCYLMMLNHTETTHGMKKQILLHGLSPLQYVFIDLLWGVFAMGLWTWFWLLGFSSFNSPTALHSEYNTFGGFLHQKTHLIAIFLGTGLAALQSIALCTMLLPLGHAGLVVMSVLGLMGGATGLGDGDTDLEGEVVWDFLPKDGLDWSLVQNWEEYCGQIFISVVGILFAACFLTYYQKKLGELVSFSKLREMCAKNDPSEEEKGMMMKRFRDPDVAFEEEKVAILMEVKNILKNNSKKKGFSKKTDDSKYDFNFVSPHNKRILSPVHLQALADFRHSLLLKENPNPKHDDVVTVSRLTKSFTDQAWTKLWATNDVSLDLERGECFGLLGPNGAGKSTLFNLLTADAEIGPPNSGSVLIFGKNANKSGFAFQDAGFCSQKDHLYPMLSAREHLRLYCKLSGMYWDPFSDCHSDKKNKRIAFSPHTGNPKSFNPEDLERFLHTQDLKDLISASQMSSLKPDFGEERIERFLRELSLDKPGVADRASESYSGGMKRRLCFACAMITDPHLVFLDEACAGVDAVSAREVWTKMQTRPVGQTIVTTTHSMEEAAATCSRIGILVAGRFSCIGSQTCIKGKYGRGYELELTLSLKEDELEMLSASHSAIINPKTRGTTSTTPLNPKPRSSAAEMIAGSMFAAGLESRSTAVMVYPVVEKLRRMEIGEAGSEENLGGNFKTDRGEVFGSGFCQNNGDAALKELVEQARKSLREEAMVETTVIKKTKLTDSSLRVTFKLGKAGKLGSAEEKFAGLNYSLFGEEWKEEEIENEVRKRLVSIKTISEEQTFLERTTGGTTYGASGEELADSELDSNDSASSDKEEEEEEHALLRNEIGLIESLENATEGTVVESDLFDVENEFFGGVMRDLGKAYGEEHNYSVVVSNDVSAPRKRLTPAPTDARSNFPDRSSAAQGARFSSSLGTNRRDSTLSVDVEAEGENDFSMAAVFLWCEKDPLNVVADYSLREPDLEDVFLRFAAAQQRFDLLKDLGNKAKRDLESEAHIGPKDSSAKRKKSKLH